MRVAHIASEVTPWSQSGGLADVAAALPRALHAEGAKVAVFSPLYRATRQRARDVQVPLHPLARVDVELGGRSFPVDIVRVQTEPGPTMCFVDAPALFDRDGLYSDASHTDYADNAVRFAVLTRAALAAAPIALGGPADIVHAHDWQTGLAPLWADCPTVFTIHNLAYRGLFPKQQLAELGLDWSVFKPEILEFHDQISFLKAGIAAATTVTTVSPTYAREILEPLSGRGLEGFLAQHADRLVGIVNGIDADEWNPATDPALPATYDRDQLGGKALCRAELVAELGVDLGIDLAKTMLAGMVTRFAEQKGLDLVADLIPSLEGTGVHIAILGTGDPALQQRLTDLAAAHPHLLTVRVGFDVALARRMYAGCDALLMPSRFEPCGLNQLYAMRYGTVPIVHAVGGLRDTVDETTGVRFEYADVEGLRWGLGHALEIFTNDRPRWRQMMTAGMERDSSWAVPARQYLALYGQLGAG